MSGKRYHPPTEEDVAALVAQTLALLERVDRAGTKLNAHGRAELEARVASLKHFLDLLGQGGTA